MRPPTRGYVLIMINDAYILSKPATTHGSKVEAILRKNSYLKAIQSPKRLDKHIPSAHGTRIRYLLWG